MSILKIYIRPVPKPRMTQRDRWAKRPAVLRYYSYKDLLLEEAKKNNFILGDKIEITYFFKVTESWTQKKKEKLKDNPHQQKPDLDNLNKAVLDSLKKEDSTVFKINSKKYWGEFDLIIIQNL